MVLQVGVSVPAVSRLDFVIPVEAGQRLLGDVDSSEKRQDRRCSSLIYMKIALADLPRKAAAFHVIRESHVVRPHVELPLSEPQDAAVHTARVYSDPHVHVHRHHFPD